MIMPEGLNPDEMLLISNNQQNVDGAGVADYNPNLYSISPLKLPFDSYLQSDVLYMGQGTPNGMFNHDFRFSFTPMMQESMNFSYMNMPQQQYQGLDSEIYNAKAYLMEDHE